jgi:hypothetical protein
VSAAWWDDLSSAELRARLMQRDVSHADAHLAVFMRDRDSRWRRFITESIGDEPGR